MAVKYLNRNGPVFTTFDVLGLFYFSKKVNEFRNIQS